MQLGRHTGASALGIEDAQRASHPPHDVAGRNLRRASVAGDIEKLIGTRLHPPLGRVQAGPHGIAPRGDVRRLAALQRLGRGQPHGIALGLHVPDRRRGRHDAGRRLRVRPEAAFQQQHLRIARRHTGRNRRARQPPRAIIRACRQPRRQRLGIAGIAQQRLAHDLAPPGIAERLRKRRDAPPGHGRHRGQHRTRHATGQRRAELLRRARVTLPRRPAGQAAPRRACNLRHRGRRQGLPDGADRALAAGQHRARSHAGDHAGDVAANIRPQPFAARLRGREPERFPDLRQQLRRRRRNGDIGAGDGVDAPRDRLAGEHQRVIGHARQLPDTLDCVAGAEAEAAREAFAQGWFRGLGAPMLLLRIGQHLVLRRAVRGGDDELAAIRGGDLEIRHQGAGRIDHPPPCPLVGVASGSAGATSFHLPTPWMMS